MIEWITVVAGNCLMYPGFEVLHAMVHCADLAASP